MGGPCAVQYRSRLIRPTRAVVVIAACGRCNRSGCAVARRPPPLTNRRGSSYGLATFHQRGLIYQEALVVVMGSGRREQLSKSSRTATRAGSRFRAAGVVTVLLVPMFAGGFGSAALAQEPPAGCDGAALLASDEAAALARAAECDAPVEIESARAYTERQVAEPDGTITLESHLRPRWAYDRAGNWVEANPTLVVDEAGAISTVATVIDVVASSGGTGPLVTGADASGASISLTWPEALPAPVLDGATATYPEVFEDVDLQLTARTDSFSYALVVRTAMAAANPQLSTVELAIAADGLAVSQAADGAVVATDANGEVAFSAAGAYMWDSSSPPPPLAPAGTASLPGGDLPGVDPGRVAEVDLTLAGDALRMEPDQAMLADPETEFPVTIDPTFTASRMAWATVGNGQYADTTWWNDGAWPRVEGLRIGFQGWTEPGSEGYGRWRSIARFNTEALRGSIVHSASVRLTVFHTGGCDSSPLQLWQVSAITQGAVPTSWNSTSGLWQHGAPLETKSVPSANGTGDWCDPLPNRAVTFSGDPIRHHVQRHADTPFASISFGLRAGDEGDMLQWMRAHTDSFKLVVNYTPVLAVPGGMTMDGVGCLSPVGGRVVGSAPELSGTPRFSEGTVRARVEVQAVGGSTALRSWQSGLVASGEPVSWQVDAPLPDGGYEWRMRSEHPVGTTAGAWSGWCGFGVDSSLDVEPGPEPAADVECPVAAGEPLEAADESTALLLAQACDAPVEVLSERDFDARVLAQPVGTLVAEQFTRPQWAWDEDGQWVGVDPSFAVGADGTISTVAAVSEIEVSPGGDGPLLTATDPDGGSVSLSWPDPLPVPVVDGATVTYPEVLPDVDLRVAAGVDGFSYVLVVKSAAAAISPELASVSVGIDAGELDVVQEADGGVTVQDAAGEAVFSAPAAYMWDSSTPVDDGAGVDSEEPGSGDPTDVPPGRFTEMPLEVAGDTVTVEPDQTLLTDPGVEFPVLIDPPFSGKRMHWATVHQQQAGRGWTDDSNWPRVGAGGKPEMRVGNLQWWPNHPCGDACGLWRSAIRFDIRGLTGKQIVSASVKATQTHTSGCGSYGLELWYVTAFKSGTSWNGLAGNWQNQLQSQTVVSSNRTGGCGGAQAAGVTFAASAVRSRVQGHADAGHDSLSFGFRSSDESSKSAYRRMAVGGVKLEVEYNRVAQPPVGLSTDGRGCSTSSPGPWLTTQRPTLSGKPRDPDGRTGAHLQVHRVGSSGVYYSWSSATNRKHNTVVNHRIPHSDRLPSGAYRWRMRSLDNHPQGTDSAWVEWCYFRVDVTSPTTPTVERLGEPPAAGEPVTLRFRSTDAHSGLAGFSYGINEEVKRSFKGSSGETTITFTTPASGGRNWIYVWSKDKAGNFSNRAVFDFFAARFVEATPVAAWRLDRDGLDDSGHGQELLLGNGVSWVDDGGPPADHSLGFDGTGCVSTEGPVVRTDAEYTVAAWVRVDDATTDQMIMGSAGVVKPGFFFRYTPLTGRWRFTLHNADVRQEASSVVFDSAQPAAVGQWTHLAVRVDPAARHMQMYVNGVLSSERAIPFIPWNAAGPMYVGCAANTLGDTWYRFDGAIHHAGVWQGLLTPAQITAAFKGELAAGVTGDWRLRESGVDGSAHARDLILPAGGVSWVDDQYGRQRSAMRLDGTGWAESTAPVVRTDRSFSVAAWVRLDTKDGSPVVLSQAGTHRSGFRIAYHPVQDRWELSMPSADQTSSVTWHSVRSSAAPAVGQWSHLVGVFDQSTRQLRLYVNGQPQGTAAGPVQPWSATGPLLVGAAGDLSGARVDRLAGTVSAVRTWRGALTDEQAAEVFGGNPAVKQLSQWNLDGSGVDLLGANPLTLVGAEGVDYDWVEDRACRPFRALGLQVSGGGFARTGGPVVVTDESYTITTWVKLEQLTGDYQTVLAQRGGGRAAMYLQVTPTGSWRLSMPQHEFGTTTWAGAESAAGVAEAGAWTHLAGVFDLAAGETRLFVDGELVAVGEAVDSPWHADGPFYIGTGGIQDGLPYQPSHASIDEVSAWSSTLDPDRILDMGSLSPDVPCL